MKNKLKGFWFEEKDGIITIRYENKIWEPIYKDKKFVGYKKKTGKGGEK